MVTVYYHKDCLKPCSPATARKLLRKRLAQTAPSFNGSFAIRLKNDEAYQEYCSSFPAVPMAAVCEGGA